MSAPTLETTGSAASMPPAPRKRRLPRWAHRAAFEALLIVFGLLLAYGVNQWREARVLNARVLEARSLVAEELRFNRDSIASAEIITHHRDLLARYRELAQAQSPMGEPLFDSGVHIAPLRDAAWRALSSPELVGHVSYREIVMLADVYQEQERLDRMHWSVVTWLLAPRDPAPDESRARAFNRSVAMYLSDVVSAEERLLSGYEQALRVLEPG